MFWFFSCHCTSLLSITMRKIPETAYQKKRGLFSSLFRKSESEIQQPSPVGLVSEKPCVWWFRNGGTLLRGTDLTRVRKWTMAGLSLCFMTAFPQELATIHCKLPQSLPKAVPQWPQWLDGSQLGPISQWCHRLLTAAREDQASDSKTWGDRWTISKPRH
jgi:hypothetical protein